MKKYTFILMALVCSLFFYSCYKGEGDSTDCESFQKKSNKEKDIVVDNYNSVQSVFYHVGGWAYHCCFHTRSGLKEGDSLKICGYVLEEFPKSWNSDYYVKIFSEKFDYRAMTKDMNQKYVLYKIGDISQNTICPCVIVGIDTTKIPIDKMNAAGEKDKKYYFKGQCFLMHVSAKIVNQKIAPGHNTITAQFVLPYIIVSNSNDIEIRQEE